MRIEPISNVTPSEKKRPSKEYTNSGTDRPRKDSVSLSFQARLRQAMNDPDSARTSSRQRKIERLRDEINEGRYELTEKIIDMIVQRMIERSII